MRERAITRGFAAIVVYLTATNVAAAQTAAASRVVVTDDEVRLRRQDVARALAVGRAVTADGGAVPLVAFRGETVAFQVVVLAGARDLQVVRLSVAALTPVAGDGASLQADVFREHYVRVDRRSRNRHRPQESLGWLPDARAPDAQMRGDVPDALIPMGLDATPVAPGPAAPAGQTLAFWVDLPVPETAAPGEYTAAATVAADGAPLARFDVKLSVRAPVLPYRASGAFVFYEAERLDKRIGDGDVVERQLWQLLHAHHLDALAQTSAGSDMERLKAVYDGTLFLPEAGYTGPGRGLPPSVVALGTYGVLGEPRDESLGRVDAMLAGVPPAIADVFLYALAARPAGARVRVGQTCDQPPERQAADIAMIPAQAFSRAAPAAARAAGRRAWIYNGVLPHSGTLLLDADPRGLIANGWIAAVEGIERWFYWESTFWNDDNAGGKGRIEPFTTAESFHNDDGDAALGDGLLLYPGRQTGKFAARSLGYTGVLPSLRLKALRRGVQDAGVIALAARERPDEVGRLIARAVPTALDEARPDEPASWDAAPLRFAEARAALRALVTNPAPMPAGEVRAAFERLASRRQQTVGTAPTRRALRLRRAAIQAAAAGAALLVGGLALVVLRRRLGARTSA